MLFSILGVVLLFVLFQNCNTAFSVKQTESASVGSTSEFANVDPEARKLYETNCASCHGGLEVSTLRGRIVTFTKLSEATKSISAMKPLVGRVSDNELSMIAAIFTASDIGPVLNSNFQCATPEAEKQSSIGMNRLTGPELKNTYRTIFGSVIWNALAETKYLLPVDNFSGSIKNIVPTYTPAAIDKISRFNEFAANEIIANNANVAAFFGTCATTASFTKACFDSFMATRGPVIYRSPLAADDGVSLWDSIQTVIGVADQQSAVIQTMLNDPRFLYHVEAGVGNPDANGVVPLSSYEIANRIAYGMTLSPSDLMLWNDAVQNRLQAADLANAHIERIAKGSAFQDRIVELVKFYIGTSTADVPVAHSEFLNGIDPTNLDVAVTKEFNEFVKYIVFTQRGTLRDLFTSKAAFPSTPAVAMILGTSVWAGGTPVTAPNHPGILSKPYFVFVDNPSTKLVQRGRKIRMNMLCTDIPQPTASDLSGRPAITDADLMTLTRRDYVDKSTLAGNSCVACHSKMNQLGFVTGNYDSIGRHITMNRIYNSNQTKVAVKPISAAAQPAITEIDTRTFNDLYDFETAFVRTDSMQQCFTRKTFQYLQRKEEVLATDSCRLNKMDNKVKRDIPLYDVFVENFKQTSLFYRKVR